MNWFEYQKVVCVYFVCSWKGSSYSLPYCCKCKSVWSLNLMCGKSLIFKGYTEQASRLSSFQENKSSVLYSLLWPLFDHISSMNIPMTCFQVCCHSIANLKDCGTVKSPLHYVLSFSLTHARRCVLLMWRVNNLFLYDMLDGAIRSDSREVGTGIRQTRCWWLFDVLRLGCVIHAWSCIRKHRKMTT